MQCSLSYLMVSEPHLCANSENTTHPEKLSDTAKHASASGSELTAIPVNSAPLRNHSATLVGPLIPNVSGPSCSPEMSQHVIIGHIPRDTEITQCGCAGSKRTSDMPVPELAANSVRSEAWEGGDGDSQKRASLRACRMSLSSSGAERTSIVTGGKGMPSCKTCTMRARVQTTRSLEMTSNRVETCSSHVYSG